jgi:hypothetical protein
MDMNLLGSSISELLPFFVVTQNDSSNGGALWEMERGFWLHDAAYYTTFLAPDCIMVFPQPPGVLVGNEIVAALEQAPRWKTIEMTNRTLVALDADVAMLTYRAIAQRDGNTLNGYGALCSSIYTRKNSQWLLVHHQQTPLPPEQQTHMKD